MVDTPHPQYEVTHQEVGMEPDGHGNFHKVMTVHYRSPSGTHSHVKVPAHVYTARNVHDAITHELKTIEHVHALGSGTPPDHES